MITPSTPAGDQVFVRRGDRNRAELYERVWSVILAGGEGERLRPWMLLWRKESIAKQFCAFVGSRTMLEHTLARADRLAPAKHQLTVVQRTHLWQAGDQLENRPQGTVILQPSNCDTGPGVFLPVTYIRERSLHSIVVIYPSDHFVYPEDRFVEAVGSAVQAAELFPDRLVLLGAKPNKPEVDYGWVVPGAELGSIGRERVHAVGGFIEKPTPAKAEQAFRSGALWNTLVMAARLETLCALGWRCFPEVMMLFDGLRDTIGTAREEEFLGAIYREMPICNFSSGLLAHVVDQLAIIPLKDVVWSDWGRPERIAETLIRIGKKPAFPPEYLVLDTEGTRASRESTGSSKGKGSDKLSPLLMGGESC